MSFQFDSGYVSSQGENVSLCGHIDRLVRFNDEIYVSDLKTTKYTLAPSFFKRFSPDNQFSLYTLAGQLVFEQKAKGLIVDAMQVIVSETRFQRGFVERTSAQLDEWLDSTHYWVGQMEQCAETQSWPQNDKSCDLYGGCPFRSVCAKSPDSRQIWLDTEFKKRIWDPTVKRGDI